ncbi:hypothetical protein GCM10018771_19610 [Streptomyces cellulosae]|nr:hypothetical protein GCM10018771_19610 [Streptomyces cellulosae]
MAMPGTPTAQNSTGMENQPAVAVTMSSEEIPPATRASRVKAVSAPVAPGVDRRVGVVGAVDTGDPPEQRERCGLSYAGKPQAWCCGCPLRVLAPRRGFLGRRAQQQ